MIPTVAECFRLMDEYGMYDNIRAHSVLVARVAERLACDLAESGAAIVVELVVAAALLHDIAKTPCIVNGGDHAAEGAAICRKHGLGELVDIVGEHVVLADGVCRHHCREKEVVYYADKRVKHDVVVSLDERLRYILKHYGRGDEGLCAKIRRNFEHCHQVEAKLFALLPYRPQDVARLVAPHFAAGWQPAMQWQGICG